MDALKAILEVKKLVSKRIRLSIHIFDYRLQMPWVLVSIFLEMELFLHSIEHTFRSTVVSRLALTLPSFYHFNGTKCTVSIIAGIVFQLFVAGTALILELWEPSKTYSGTLSPDLVSHWSRKCIRGPHPSVEECPACESPRQYYDGMINEKKSKQIE